MIFPLLTISHYSLLSMISPFYLHSLVYPIIYAHTCMYVYIYPLSPQYLPNITILDPTYCHWWLSPYLSPMYTVIYRWSTHNISIYNCILIYNYPIHRLSNWCYNRRRTTSSTWRIPPTWAQWTWRIRRRRNRFWRWDEGAVRESQPTLPSGKHTKNDGKSLFLMGKLTISTGPFSIAMSNYQRVSGFRQIYGDFSHDSKQQKGDFHQEFLWNSRNRNGNFSHKELSHRNGEWMESTNRNGELGCNW